MCALVQLVLRKAQEFSPSSPAPSGATCNYLQRVGNLLPWDVTNNHNIVLAVNVEDSPAFLRIPQQALHAKEPF